MDYLWWYVPVATAPMLIAFIATVHVFVSHYAVGGGIFLAAETQWAHKQENKKYLDYLKSHAKFFVLLTVVFGAITGVGIWWTIALASPLATETLIRTFVFGWGTEWVFFVLELAAAFFFYYLWDRLSPRNHTIMGWIYALAAWISLVLITGITAFMLDPGKWPELTQAGTQGTAFWAGFFNPQFLPQTIARTGAALLLASSYVLFHASIFTGEDAELKTLVVRRSVRYILAGVALAVIGAAWSGAILSDAARMAMLRAAALNIILGAGAGAAGMLVLLLLLLVWKPKWLTPVAGVAVLLASFGVLTAGEFVREALRKPYVLVNCVYGNQIHVSQVAKLRETGLLENGRWTKEYMAEKFPYVVDSATGKLNLDLVRPEDANAVGEVIFMHHCNDCHARTLGYNGLSLLSTSARKGELKELLLNLDSMIYYMPPWCGTEKEAELLAGYLESIAEPHPAAVAETTLPASLNEEGSTSAQSSTQAAQTDDAESVVPEKEETSSPQIPIQAAQTDDAGSIVPEKEGGAQ